MLTCPQGALTAAALDVVALLCPLLDRGGTSIAWLATGTLRAIPITLERPAPRVEKDEVTAWCIRCEGLMPATLGGTAAVAVGWSVTVAGGADTGGRGIDGGAG